MSKPTPQEAAYNEWFTRTNNVAHESPQAAFMAGWEAARKFYQRSIEPINDPRNDWEPEDDLPQKVKCI